MNNKLHNMEYTVKNVYYIELEKSKFTIEK